MSRSYFLCNTSPRCAAECLVSTEIYEPIHKEFQARGLIGNEEHRVRMPVPCQDRTGADRPRPEWYGAGASVSGGPGASVSGGQGEESVQQMGWTWGWNNIRHPRMVPHSAATFRGANLTDAGWIADFHCLLSRNKLTIT
jgi:hypothetical protein